MNKKTIKDYGEPTRFKTIGKVPGNSKLGKKDFAIRFPVEYENVLNSMSSEERITMMRFSVMRAIEEKGLL